MLTSENVAILFEFVHRFHYEQIRKEIGTGKYSMVSGTNLLRKSINV